MTLQYKLLKQEARNLPLSTESNIQAAKDFIRVGSQISGVDAFSFESCSFDSVCCGHMDFAVANLSGHALADHTWASERNYNMERLTFSLYACWKNVRVVVILCGHAIAGYI